MNPHPLPAYPAARQRRRVTSRRRKLDTRVFRDRLQAERSAEGEIPARQFAMEQIVERRFHDAFALWPGEA